MDRRTLCFYQEDIVIFQSMKLLDYFIGNGCIIRSKFHVYCPGCGGTRAIVELLHLHFLQSLYDNPVPICLLLDALLMMLTWYIEKKISHYGRYLKLRKYSKVVLLVIIFGFTIIRNYLLVFQGIDMLGDFT